MAETHLPLAKGAREDLVISDTTTAPQYSELGGSGNRCPHFADKKSEGHSGQMALFRARG